VCIQLLPFLSWSFLLWSLLSCITNSLHQHRQKVSATFGLSTDRTLLTQSNFYLSHLRKLESFRGAFQIQWSAQLSTYSLIIHRELLKLFWLPQGISTQNSMQRTQPWPYTMQRIFLQIIWTNNIQAGKKCRGISDHVCPRSIHDKFLSIQRLSSRRVMTHFVIDNSHSMMWFMMNGRTIWK